MLQSIEFTDQSEKSITSFNVTDYFATLVSENADGYQFNFAYNILKSDVEQGIESLKLSVYPKSYDFGNPSTSSDIAYSEKLNAFINAKIKAKSLIYSENINLTFAYQNSTNIANSSGPLHAYTKVLKLIPSPTIIGSDINSSIDSIKLREKLLKLIIDYKVDLSEALITQSPSLEADITIKEIKDYFLFQALNGLNTGEKYYEVNAVPTVQQKLFFNSTLSVPKKFLDTELEVIFELYKAGLTVSPYKSIKKSLVVSSHLAIKNRVRNKPLLNVSTTGNANKLEFAQTDVNAVNLVVQKKSILKSGEVSFYRPIASYPNLFKDDSKKIDETNDPSEIEIYRCLSYGQSINNKVSSYKNLVAGTTFPIDPTVIVLTNDQVANGVSIELMQIPSYVKQVRIQRRKLLVEPAIFGEYIDVCSYQELFGSNFKTIDYDVTTESIYEYKVTYKDGSNIYESVSKSHKFLRLLNKNISVSLSTPVPSVVNNKPSISFDIVTQPVDVESNIVKSALESEGIYEIFKDVYDVANADTLQDLIFYKVTRTNLSVSPGIEEQFLNAYPSKTTTSFIDDVNAQKASNVSELNPFHTYRYSLYAYYKSPLAILKDYVKTVILNFNTNDNKKREYSYKPYEWLQTKKGTFSPVDIDGKLLIPSQLENGEGGVVAEATYVGLKQILQLENCNATRFDVKKVILNWGIKDSIQNYDHFVIVKESAKKRQILNVVTCTQYVDELSLEDLGTIIYYIIPVFNDYSVGNPIKSNHVTYDPEEAMIAESINKFTAAKSFATINLNDFQNLQNLKV